MVRRLQRGGHRCVVYDRDPSSVERLAAGGSASLAELVERIEAPRAVWIMVPAGEPTEATVDALVELLAAGEG